MTFLSPKKVKKGQKGSQKELWKAFSLSFKASIDVSPLYTLRSKKNLVKKRRKRRKRIKGGAVGGNSMLKNCFSIDHVQDRKTHEKWNPLHDQIDGQNKQMKACDLWS